MNEVKATPAQEENKFSGRMHQLYSQLKEENDVLRNTYNELFEVYHQMTGEPYNPLTDPDENGDGEPVIGYLELIKIEVARINENNNKLIELKDKFSDLITVP